LEFLGDSVLGLVITDYLFHLFPTMPEGELAKVRASVVSAPALAKAAAQVSLGEALLLGKGEESSGGRLKESILADALEALIGALYLEGGWSAAQSFVLGLLAQKARQAAKVPGGADYKTRLQEFVTRRDDEVPRYEVQGFGPDHARMFTACVYVGGELVGRGDGRSKKQAEQAAAQQAWGRLGAGEPESSKPSKGECDAGVA
jgi:ribonuclease-3